MRYRHRAITALALTAAALPAPPARAEEPRLDLTWSAPAGCPTEADVRAGVEKLAGHAARSAAKVRIDAEPTDGGTYRARITVEPPGAAAPRERRIQGATCAEVADAAIVAAALALTSEPEPPPQPEPAAPEPITPPVDLPVPPVPPVSTHPRFGMRAAGGVDFATLPAPAPGVEVAAVLSVGANRVEIFGSAWAPESAMLMSKPGAGAHLSLLTAGARYCRAFTLRVFEIAGCGGIEAGAILGSAFGVQKPAPGVAPWVAPGLGVQGSWNLSPRFSLSLSLAGLGAVVRERFTVMGLGQIYTPPPVTGRSLLGLELRFQ